MNSAEALGKYQLLDADSGVDHSNRWWGYRIYLIPKDEMSSARPYFARSIANHWPGEDRKIYGACIHSAREQPFPGAKDHYQVTCRYAKPDLGMVLDVPGRGYAYMTTASEARGVWIGMRSENYIDYYNNPYDYLRGAEPTHRRSIGSNVVFIKGDASQVFPQAWLIVEGAQPISKWKELRAWNAERVGWSNSAALDNLGVAAGTLLYWGAELRPSPDDVSRLMVRMQFRYDERGWEFTGSYVLAPTYKMDADGNRLAASMKLARVKADYLKADEIPEDGYKMFEDRDDRTVSRGNADFAAADEYLAWMYEQPIT